MSPRGFTLVELMVGMLLASIAIASVLTAVAGTSRRHREFETRTLLRERAMHAVGVLVPEVQMAGFGGLRALRDLVPPAALPAGATACGTLAPDRVPVSRIDTAYALPCAAAGGGAAPLSDVLTFVRASARTVPAEAARLQVWTDRRTGEPQGLTAGGAMGAPAVEGLREVRNLLVNTFYVATRADGPADAGGSPALRLKELTSIDDRPVFRDVEVLAGVERLRAFEGRRESDGDPLRFTRPVSGAHDEPEALRLCVLVRSPLPIVPPRNTQFRCGDEDWSFQDGYLRVLVEREIASREAATVRSDE